MIEIRVNGQIVSVQETEPLYSGSADIQMCHFTFDKSWDGFGKSALFRVGAETHTKLVDENGCCVLPWELMTHRNAGRQIEVGMYGVSADTELVTSVWDSLGIIREGSRPGSDARNPTDGVYEQIMAKVQNIHEEVGIHDKAMRTLVQRAETAEKSAVESATKAASSESEAASSEANAAASEGAAGRSAESARLSAESASGSASTAVNSANAAATSAQQAAECENQTSEDAAAALSAKEIAEESAIAAVAAAGRVENMGVEANELPPGSAATVEKQSDEKGITLLFGIPLVKSAYQYALDGGYTGTEEEFMTMLAADTGDGLAQTTGDSDRLVMSQNAVTEALKAVDIFRGILNAEDDLDNISNGSYCWVGGSVPVNAPFSSAGAVIQYGNKSGSGGVQIASSAAYDRHYIRFRTSSGGWGAFKQIITESQWNDILAQTTGSDTTKVMSQNAVTEALKAVDIFRGILNAENDLDNISNGSYCWVGGSVPVNAPFSSAGAVIQYGNKSGTGGVQIVTSATNQTYIRFRTLDSGWGAFTQVPKLTQTTGTSETLVMSQNAVTEALKNIDIFKKVLTNADDLDSIGNGSYCWVGGSVPVNSPFSSAGAVLQHGNKSGTGGVQIASSATNNHYVRYRTASGWGAFKQITTEIQWSDIDELRDLINKYNTIDAFLSTNGKTSTSNGVTYTKNDDGSWTLNGTAASANSFCNILNYASKLPDTIIAGRKYYFDLHGGTVPLRVYVYRNDGSNTFVTVEKNKTVTIAENVIGVIVRFQIAEGTTVDNVTVKYSMLSEPLVGELTSTVVNNNTFENTYNITCTPEITVDEDGWLKAVDEDTEDETGKTDMTGAIMAMLSSTGHCKLGPGVFYVSGNIDMPQNSTIEGCGGATDLRLLASVESGYVIKPTRQCTIKNLSISGAKTKITSPPSTLGARHGIYGVEGLRFSEVSDVFIRSFSGGGITLKDTGINYEQCLMVSNAFITGCHAGINLERESEFNKFVNCVMSWCYYACVNNGGNNAFTNCTFHATNTGFLIEGSSYNSAHGLCVGGTFCHIGSNEGSAITVRDAANGYVFTGCQVHFDSINVTNSHGIVFNAIEFGRGTTGEGAVINIDGGGLVMFNGCVFMNDAVYTPQITVTNNELVKFVNCYGSHTGMEYPVTSD